MATVHYICIAVQPHAEPLIFDWDEVAGTVAGPSADLLRRIASFDQVEAHPLPQTHHFGAEPLKSGRDMAAIIGSEWRLPADLAPFYPHPPEVDYADLPEGAILG